MRVEGGLRPTVPCSSGFGEIVGQEFPSSFRASLRHSFGSYHYAQHSDENRTAAEMGNTPAVIFRHYRALVKPEATKAFWLLRPASDDKTIVSDAQAA